jgi:hypothetical protein
MGGPGFAPGFHPGTQATPPWSPRSFSHSSQWGN